MIELNPSETNPEWGKPPNERTVEEMVNFGVISLDKPPGPSSHLVTDWVKKIVGAKKAGHSGTLDPKVSGVLPIGLNESTKVIGTLLSAGKEYICLMHLHKQLPKDKITKNINEFIGTIKQRPPVRSAVKRVTRKREIYSIDILEINGKDVLFKTDVQAGTYIRKLCSDIGKKLGCGAHMAELRRTRAGPFTEKCAVTLHQLTDAWAYWKEEGSDSLIRKIILPVERAVEHLPKVVIKDGAVNSLCYGSALAVPGIVRLDENIEKGSFVAIFTLKGELVALGKAQMTSSDITKTKKGWVLKTDRVILPKDIYPKGWVKKS